MVFDAVGCSKLNRSEQREQRQEHARGISLHGVCESSLNSDPAFPPKRHTWSLKFLCWLCFLLLVSASFRQGKGGIVASLMSQLDNYVAFRQFFVVERRQSDRKMPYDHYKDHIMSTGRV